MNTLFLKLLNISITASWLVLAVCALRLLLKRTPKSFRCIMWAIVGIRLLSPFSFESVLSLMGTDNKKSYCETLINCSVPHRKVTACPLAFGEVGVKERIKNILHYRRPTIWITVAGAAVCIALVVCFLTNPKSTDYMPAGDRKTYFFSDSADPMDPTIQLNEKDHSFQFIYSALSSYIAAGKYELTDKFLTLRTEDGSYTYVFKVKDEGFVFDGAKSSKIPEYKYSATSSDTECPVPDGAVFVLLK